MRMTIMYMMHEYNTLHNMSVAILAQAVLARVKVRGVLPVQDQYKQTNGSFGMRLCGAGCERLFG